MPRMLARRPKLLSVRDHEVIALSAQNLWNRRLMKQRERAQDWFVAIQLSARLIFNHGLSP